MKQLLAETRRFDADETGSVTVLNVYFTIVLCILAGIAIDLAMLTQARTQLQVAADAAAHAAIVTREWEDEATSKAKAVEVANANLSPAFGVALEESDIVFGTYDKASHVFTADSSVGLDSVYVMTERALADSNPVGSFLLKFIGFTQWDVRTTSVYETYVPTCFREGFVAGLRIDIQSRNDYKDGFCIHSNTHVEVNQNNTYETGVIVSMPNTDDLVIPANATDKNEGLDKALRSSKYDIKILNRLDEIKNGLNDPNSKYYRDFLISNSIVTKNLTKNNNTLTKAEIVALSPDNKDGHIYNLNCTKPDSTLTLSGGPYHDMAIITNCIVSFGSNEHIYDFSIVITNEDDNSWSSSSSLTLGIDDNCGDGGSAQIVTYGGSHSAAGLEIYGSQVIAAKNIAFTSQAIGHGAAVVAGGTIDGTTNMNMAYCGANMDDNFTAEYFRLAG